MPQYRLDLFYFFGPEWWSGLESSPRRSDTRRCSSYRCITFRQSSFQRAREGPTTCCQTSSSPAGASANHQPGPGNGVWFSAQRHMALARSLSKPERQFHLQIQRINAMAMGLLTGLCIGPLPALLRLSTDRRPCMIIYNSSFCCGWTCVTTWRKPWRRWTEKKN